MDADTDLHQNKKEVALFIAGTIGYLAIKNNDYIGMLYSANNKIIYKPFKYNLYNLEEYLIEYDKFALNNTSSLNETLNFLYKNISKKMIVFIITDISGVDNIDNKILKSLSQIHDILLININDNLMFGEEIFDIEKNEYIPKFLLNDKKLNELEKEIKKNILKKASTTFKKYNISMTSISGIEQINNKIIKLLEEHKYASKN